MADRVDTTISISTEGTDQVKAEYDAMTAKVEEMNKKFAAQAKESEALKSKLDGLTSASSKLGKEQGKTTKTTKKSSRAALDNARAIGNLQDGMVALLQATTHTRSGFVNGLRAFDNFGRVLAVLAPKLGILGFALSGLVVVVRGLADRFFDLGKSAKDAEQKMAALKAEVKSVRGVLDGLRSDIGNVILPLEKLTELRRISQEIAKAEAKEAAAGARATAELGGARAELAKREAKLLDAKTKLNAETEKQKASQGELSDRFDATARALARKNGYVDKLQQLEINAKKAEGAFAAQKKVVAGINDEYNKAAAGAVRLRDQQDKLLKSLKATLGPQNQKDDAPGGRGRAKKEARDNLKFFNAQQAAIQEMQGHIEQSRAKAIEKGIEQRLALFDKETESLRRKFAFFGISTEKFEEARGVERLRIQEKYWAKGQALREKATQDNINRAIEQMRKQEEFDNQIGQRHLSLVADEFAREEALQELAHQSQMRRAESQGLQLQGLREVQEKERTALMKRHAARRRLIMEKEVIDHLGATVEFGNAMTSLAETFGVSERAVAAMKGLVSAADAIKSTAEAYFAFARYDIYAGAQYTAAAAANIAASVAYFKVAGGGGSSAKKPSRAGGGGRAARQPSERDLGGEGRGARQSTVNVNNFSGHFYDTREGAGRALGAFVTQGQNQNSLLTGRPRLTPQAIDRSQSGRRR